MIRIPALDGIRAIAILLVVISHSTFSTGFPSILIPTCQKIFNGNIGVNIFFSLSGFLITSILLDEYKSYSKINLYNFYIKRIFRIIPVFYVYLLVATISNYLMYNIIDWYCIGSSAFFIYNFSISCNWVYAHSWSLSIEEQFYFLLPTIVFIKFRFNMHWFYVLMISVLLFSILYKNIEPSGVIGNIISFFMLHSNYLFAGVFFSILYNSYKLKIEVILKKLQLIFYPLVIMVFIQYYLTTNRFSYIIMPALDIILPISVCLIILLSIVNTDTFYHKFLNQSQIVFLGKISYSLYLWQQLFIYPKGEVWWRFFPINILMALICAMISYNFIEMPSIKARKIFLKNLIF